MKNQDEFDFYVQKCVLNLLFLKNILAFISPLLSSIGISNVSTITTGLYLFVFAQFIYITYKNKGIVMSDFFIVLSFYLFYFINYCLFPMGRKYYLTSEMYLIYLVYIPICVIGILKVKDWSSFFKVGRRYSYWGVILAAGVFVFKLTNHLNYMEFSYSILVFASIAAVNSALENNRIDFISFISYAVIIILYGSRTPLLLLIGLYFVSVLISKNRTKNMFRGAIILLFSAIFLNTQLFDIILKNTPNNANSYIIDRLLTGSFFQSKERNELYNATKEYLFSMGFKAKGLFGDRPIAEFYGQPYVHNIFYELLISFGWVIGICIIIWYGNMCIRILFKEDLSKRYLIVFLLFAILGRYCVSGSFVNEGRFYIGTALLCSLYKERSTSLRFGSIKNTNRNIEE